VFFVLSNISKNYKLFGDLAVSFTLATNSCSQGYLENEFTFSLCSAGANFKEIVRNKKKTDLRVGLELYDEKIWEHIVSISLQSCNHRLHHYNMKSNADQTCFDACMN
jgi:hypothetical protein